ncbi:two-component regulator propeller domain-containing protein [Anaerolineales bacterium HSG6]|nr:two-component regulator propeller domain-containing protein [Anaerolineales bacterium HSG6]
MFVRIKVWFLLVGLWIGVSVAPLYAQEPVINFERITLEDGLPHGTVFSMVQDQQGFLWLGTQHGLTRYDGYTFKSFLHDPNNSNSVSNDNAGNLYIDSYGIIWVGTWGGGLNRFDPRTEQFTHYLNDPDDPTSLSNNRVQTMFEDSQGTLWVGTAGGGLNKLDKETGTFTIYRYDPADYTSISHDRVWRIVEDAAGLLWIATSDGLNHFDPEEDVFNRYYHVPDAPTTLSSSEIRVLYINQDNRLWVGTEGGLNRFDTQTETFTRYYHDPDNPQTLGDNIINAIHQDRQGQLWVGTSRGGLNKFHADSETFTRYQNNPQQPNSLSYNDVRWILEDKTEVMWIATRGGGVNKFVPIIEKFIYFSSDSTSDNSLSNNDVRAILVDDQENIWIGTRGGGLNKYNPQTDQFTHYHHDPNDPNSLLSDAVATLHQDKNGQIWIGFSDAGLSRFDPVTEQFTIHYLPDPDNPDAIIGADISSMYEESSGNIWFGTYGHGINYFDVKAETFTNYQYAPNNPNSLSNNDIGDIYQDADGYLWIATYGGGLSHFNPQTGQFKNYQYNPDDPTSVSSNELYSIYQDQTGIIWLGTNGGLNRFDPTSETFTLFTQNDGLPSNVVYGVFAGPIGNLWISTNRGLSQFTPETKTFITYDNSDGLESIGYNETAYYQAPNGQIFFGGINGLLSFNPADIEPTNHSPSVVLTALNLPHRETKFDQPLGQLDELVLTYQDESFTIEFVALDYTNPTRNQYAYQLEGFDTGWIEAGNRRFASYTNLDAREYTFRVKAANSHKVWSEADTSLKIVVTPPWWQTWWAYFIYILLAVGAVFGYVRYRTQAQAQVLAQQKKELAQERQLNEQLQRADQLQAESLREATENKNRLTQFLDAMPVNVAIIDPDGNLYYHNQLLQQASEITGLTVKQLLSKHVIRRADTKEAYQTGELPIALALQGQNITRDDIEFHTEKGTRSIEVWARPIFNSSGEISYAIAVFQDITERKKAERERLQLSAIQQELSIAQAIQQSLLTQTSANEAGLNIASHSVAAHNVGGDWYTHHAVDEDRFAIAVGDVSGKGIPAALLMAVSLASFQTVVQQELSPGPLLAQLDRSIQQYTINTQQNCAICYIELNLAESTIRIANAGCIPPYIKRHDGSVEWPDIGGMPLGVGLGHEQGYQEISLTLSSNDMVILVSDGVVEANNMAGEMYGFDRLQKLLETAPVQTAQAMLNLLRYEVSTFMGEAELHDDLTIVVVQQD